MVNFLFWGGWGWGGLVVLFDGRFRFFFVLYLWCMLGVVFGGGEGRSRGLRCWGYFWRWDF